MALNCLKVRQLAKGLCCYIYYLRPLHLRAWVTVLRPVFPVSQHLGLRILSQVWDISSSYRDQGFPLPGVNARSIRSTLVYSCPFASQSRSLTWSLIPREDVMEK